jgi:nucleoid-associated protein YgaU
VASDRTVRTYIVKSGESLRSIAASVYGDEDAWADIFQANGDVIFDPDLVRPGTRLKIP